MSRYVLALDQGTTSSRAIVFDRGGPRGGHGAAGVSADLSAARARRARPGGRSGGRSSQTARDAMAQAGAMAARHRRDRRHQPARDDRALGPRDRTSGRQRHRLAEPRDAPASATALKAAGHEPTVARARPASCSTPTSPASKIKHLLDTTDGLAGPRRARRDALRHHRHVSHLAAHRRPCARDRRRATPAARCSTTSTRSSWDDELLATLRHAAADAARGAPDRARSTARPSPGCSAARSRLPGRRATSRRRLFGQACFEAGEAKNTYGTGCFMLLNTGEQPVASQNGLLTTVGWRIGDNATYCLEGSVFIAGAVGAVAARRPAASSAPRPMWSA